MEEKRYKKMYTGRIYNSDTDSSHKLHSFAVKEKYVYTYVYVWLHSRSGLEHSERLALELDVFIV